MNSNPLSAGSQIARSSASKKRPSSLPLPWEWLNQYRGAASGPSFAGQWPTIPELFDLTVYRYGKRPGFIVFDPEELRWSYSQVQEQVLRIASWLREKGIAPGDKVVVSGKNSPQWAVTYLAVLYAGATIVPVDHGLHLHEALGLISFSDAKIVFIDSEKHPDLCAGSAGEPAQVEQLTKVEQVVCLEPLEGSLCFDHLEPSSTENLPVRVSGDQTAAILFTSGTTGNPKGVMLSHDNLVCDVFYAQYLMPLYETDIFYALLPIHHSYTMTAVFLESLSVGAGLVFGKKMVTTQILKDLKAGAVTMFLGVPLLFNKVLAGIIKKVKAKGPVAWGLIRTLMSLSGTIKKLFGSNPGKKLFGSILEKASLDTIRICISGGGPLSPSTFKRFNQMGLDFVQGYGLTETSPIVALNPTWRYKETSVGAIFPGTEIRIAEPDEQGRGTVEIKGPMVMQGYYNNPGATADVLLDDGFLRTGDVGKLDNDGYLYLTGRAKNLIVTEGGKNVYPEEIENAFQMYGEVDQVLVRGFVADEATKSEQIEVLLYPLLDNFGGADSPNWNEAEERMKAIVNEINGGLHPYQRMTKVTVLREAMEMTTTKKIKRHEVEG